MKTPLVFLSRTSAAGVHSFCWQGSCSSESKGHLHLNQNVSTQIMLLKEVSLWIPNAAVVIPQSLQHQATSLKKMSTSMLLLRTASSRSSRAPWVARDHSWVARDRSRVLCCLLRCWGFKEREDEGSDGILCFALASPQDIYCNNAFRGEVTWQIAAITGGFTVSFVLCFGKTSLRLDLCEDHCEHRVNLCLIPL